MIHVHRNICYNKRDNKEKCACYNRRVNKLKRLRAHTVVENAGEVHIDIRNVYQKCCKGTNPKHNGRNIGGKANYKQCEECYNAQNGNLLSR